MYTIDDSSVLRGAEVPVLLTERLRLREWTTSDIDMLNRLHDKPAVTRFFNLPRTKPASLDEIMADWYRHGFGAWAVADRKSNQFLGMISLASPGHWPTPEISWVLEPSVWNQGLATEGARAVLRHAFSALELPEVMSVCLLGNKASERVMQKLGMQRTSYLATASRDQVIRTYLLTHEQWRIQTNGRRPTLR